MTGLPSLAGPEHVGLTVPDLDDAVRFFTAVIGGTLVFHGGRVADQPALMRDNLGVSPQAAFAYAFVRCGNGANFELFEYSAPDQSRTPPRNSDAGGHHIAFYVDDIDAGVRHLSRHGVAVMGEVNRITDGPAAGSSWVYFLAPWGLQLELVSYPHGKAYEARAAQRLWHPAFPAR